MRIRLALPALLVASTSIALHARRQRPEELGAVARAGHDRRVAHREAADRMERDQEHQVEGRDPRPRLVVAGRLERSRLPAHRDSRRRDRCRAARAARRAAASAACINTRSSRSIARPARPSGSTSRAKKSRTKRRTRTTARWASSSAITDGTARVRLLRIARPLRLRHERQADLAGRLRRQEDAQPVRRGLDAGPPRQHAGRRLGSSRSAVVRDRARQEHRQGTVARRSSRDGHLGHAARRRARRPARR